MSSFSCAHFLSAAFATKYPSCLHIEVLQKALLHFDSRESISPGEFMGKYKSVWFGKGFTYLSEPIFNNMGQQMSGHDSS